MTTTVALCTVTLGRPNGLERLLTAIGRLQLDGWDDVRIRVVVVDNDADGSARTVVEQCRARVPWPVEYEVEPRRGIPFARNRAVRMARDANYVGFLDDDEAPEPDWLVRLLEVQRATGADVVIGPSIPEFEVEPPPWIVEGRFFERERFATGHPITFTNVRTSGVLIASRNFSDEHPFDERFGLGGGSDRLFFTRLHMAGGSFRWADEAHVVERVPASRATAGWLIRRAYRTGNSRSVVLRLLGQATPARTAKRVLAGGWSITRGSFFLALSVVRGKAAKVQALRQIAYGAGLVTGIVGRAYEEYRVVHGQ